MRFPKKNLDNVQAMPEREKAGTKRKLRLSNNRFPTLLVILFVLFLIFSYGGQLNKLSAMGRDVESMKVQIGEMKNKNMELREELDRARSEAYIEKVARQELGLIKPGEMLVVPLDDSNPGQSPAQSTMEQIIRD